MPNENSQNSDGHHTPRHLKIKEPSAWVTRFAPLIPGGGTVLDVACGGGRNSRYVLDLGYTAVAVDRDTSAVEDLAPREQAEVVTADLEDGSPWPFENRHFDGIIVTNYLYRPLLARLVDSLNNGGVLIYETFARGNEVFSRPRNPDHLLIAGELLDLVQGKLHVVAYEHGRKSETPLPGVIQRICAVKTDGNDAGPMFPLTP
jgi:SAM-dependent methyltransferase